GDQAAFAQLVRWREIAERTAASAYAPRNCAAIAYQVKAHLAARTFSFQVRFPFGKFFSEFNRFAPRALGAAVPIDGLPHEVHRLHYFQHSHIKPVPTIAE